MATVTASITEELSGKPRISYEEFLALDTELHVEWVDGEVVLMPSVGQLHSDTVEFLLHMLRSFLEERPLGRLFHDPFQLQMPHSGRAPDLMLLLTAHLPRLRELFIEGASDLAIEVVSPSGARRDYVEKFREYEEAGVLEYWIIDPANREATFFVLVAGRYEAASLEDGIFRSRVLDGFWLREEWLWERPAVRPLIAEILGG